MPEASLVFRHPRDGTTILEVTEYRTNAAGGLVAATASGRQVVVGPAVDYVVEDWLDGEGEP